MYLIITQCFASRVGGIENLVTNLALNLSIKNEVVVFADSHLYIQDEVFDSSKKNLLKIFRYGGIKFLRRRKKAHDIKLFLQNKKIDGIFSDTWKSLELCIDEINILNIPTICLAHGNELLFTKEKRKKRIIKVLKKTKKIVTNSKYTFQLVKNLGINESNIAVVNPGTEDLRLIERKNKYDIIGNPVLITLARLEKRKGHQKVLEAIKELKADFPQIKYIIAGEGPEKKSLSKLTTKLNINDFVLFIDNVDNEGKKEIFEKSTLMVMPTSNESQNRSIEGFGIVFIEAALFGIASIATNIGGTSDAIIHEETGLLLNNEDNLYLTLKKILENKEKLELLGKNAKKRVIENFLWDDIVKIYLEHFKS